MSKLFESPRFAGDPLLVEILNDPDTGTRKLEPGSPPESVMILQKALFDLTWTLQLQPALTVEEEFVVGVYGPKTTETVKLLKTRYGIHFPPSAPDGVIDGLAGPRTFEKLDQACVLRDEAAVAITEKAAALAGGGVATELIGVAPQPFPIERTSGAFQLARVSGTNGAILYKRGVGAFEVHGPIFDTYLSTFARGPFGFPTADERDDDTPGFRVSQFEHGLLRLESATGVVSAVGPEPAEQEERPVF